MAFGTDLYVNVFLSRTSYKFITAVANDLGLIVIWVDSLFHDFHLFVIWYMTDSHVSILICPLEQLNKYNIVYFQVQVFFHEIPAMNPGQEDTRLSCYYTPSIR